MVATAPALRRRSVVVIGKESVGKSALISSLTGRHAQASNFRGSTVACEVYSFGSYEFVDTPGILCNSDTETTRAAVAQLKSHDAVLLVAQATHLDQDLADLLPFVRGHHCVIVATFWDKLSQLSSQTSDVLHSLKKELRLDIVLVDARNISASERDSVFSSIDAATQSHLETAKTKVGWLLAPSKTWLEHRWVGIPLAILLLFLPAWIAIWSANTVASLVEPLVQELLRPIILLFQFTPSIIHEVLVGNYGLITMGPLLFVWAVPTVILYAMILGIYKASGLLDRISAAMHPVVRHLGLSGRDLVRVMMGFGCNVPAVIGTRACSSCSRTTTISVIAFGSACSYQFGATLAVFAVANRPYLVIPFLAYLGLTTAIYSRLVSSPASRSPFNLLVLEGRTFLAWPTLNAVWREASFTISSFFKKAIPIFFAITLIASLLAWTGALGYFAELIRPVMTLFRLPAEAALPTIMSLIRKDGLLLLAKYESIATLTDVQLLTAVYLAGELMPCLVTLFTIAREKSRGFAALMALRQAVAVILFSLVLAWCGRLL